MLKSLLKKLILIRVFQFNDLNREVFAWMIVFSQQWEVVVDGGRSGLAAVLLRAIASPNNPLRLAIRNHVFVSIMQQHFAALRRLSKDELLLAQLLTAHDFLQDLWYACRYGKKQKDCLISFRFNGGCLVSSSWINSDLESLLVKISVINLLQ